MVTFDYLCITHEPALNCIADQPKLKDQPAKRSVTTFNSEGRLGTVVHKVSLICNKLWSLIYLVS